MCCVTWQGLRYYAKQRILRMVCIHLLHFSCWVRTYRMEIMREWSRETNTSLQASFDIHRWMLSELGPLWHILLMETPQLRCPQPGRLISPWQVSSQKPSLMECGDSSLFVISKGLSPSPLLILLFPLITGLEKNETNNPWMLSTSTRISSLMNVLACFVLMSWVCIYMFWCSHALCNECACLSQESLVEILQIGTEQGAESEETLRMKMTCWQRMRVPVWSTTWEVSHGWVFRTKCLSTWMTETDSPWDWPCGSCPWISRLQPSFAFFFFFFSSECKQSLCKRWEMD